jgi:hypothetical protein
MNGFHDERSGLRVVFWLGYAVLVFLSLSPKSMSSRGPIHGPGYFQQYGDDPLMLAIGGLVLIGIALIGLRI